MNVSPHHQRPTRYPWPGLASRGVIVLGLVLIALIAFVVIADPWSNDGAEPTPSGARTTAAQRA